MGEAPVSIAMVLDNAFRPDPRVANEARSLAEAGFRVTILAWDREGELPRREVWHSAPSGGQVVVERLRVRSRHRLGSRQVFHLGRFWWRAFWRLLEMPVDAIHCHDFIDLPVGWAAAAVKGCRLVYDAHESYADMLGENVAGWIKRTVEWLERRLIRRADAVLTVGELLAEELRRRGARRVWVVGNWKRLEEFRVEPERAAALRRELGMEGLLVVCYIGWLNEDRGISPLVEAVERAEGVGLVIGGDGPARDVVEGAAARCARVRYLGFVDPGKVPLYTLVSDVVYYGLDRSNPNSRYSAPNKLFEALAAGRAVLCNDCGELARIVAEEGCGVIVEDLSAGAIEAALADLAKPGRLGECQARALEAGRRRYNWAEAQEVLLTLYGALGLAPRSGDEIVGLPAGRRGAGSAGTASGGEEARK